MGAVVVDFGYRMSVRRGHIRVSQSVDSVSSGGGRRASSTIGTAGNLEMGVMPSLSITVFIAGLGVLRMSQIDQRP